MSPRKPSRFVKQISDDELHQLTSHMERGETARIRHRAHAVILSHQGKSLKEIADIFAVDRDTVANWLDRFDRFGLNGLSDQARPGAKPKLNDSERELLLNLWEKYNMTPKKVLEEFERRTEKRISASTLRRVMGTSTCRQPGKNPRKPR